MYNDKGILLHKLQQYEEALEAYKLAISSGETISQLSPKYIDNYRRQGSILLKLHRYKKAQNLYEFLISLTPQDVQVYIGKGVALYHQRHYEEALSVYE